MKKLLLSILFLTLCTTAWAGRLDDPDILKGYWRLNSNAKDYSGYGNDGTITGGDLYINTPWGSTGLDLEGNNDYVTIPHSQAISSAGQITVTAWVNPDVLTRGDIVSQWESGEQHFNLLGGLTSGKFQFCASITGSSGTCTDTGASTFAAGQWYFVVGTYDGTNRNLYVNGMLENDKALASMYMGSTNSIYIGVSENFSSDFNGKIAEVRIYNIALTADEIKELYQRNLPQFSAQAQPYDVLPDTSDSSLKLAVLNKGVVGGKDLSSNNNDGTATGVIWKDTGAYINGASGSGITVGAGTSLDASVQTVTFWMKRNSVATSDEFIYSNGEYNVDGFYIIVADGTAGSPLADLSVRTNSSGGTELSTDSLYTSTTNWEFIAIIVDNTNKQISYYVNGEFHETDTYSNAYASTASNTKGIGYYTNLVNYEFTGQIKDVRIYSEAKTADWIKAEYLKSVPDDSLVLSTINGVDDLSRYDTSATVTSAPVLGGNGINFDGTDDKIDYGDKGNIRTIVMWVEPNTTTQELVLIDTSKDIMVDSGTVTYETVTATATYVNGTASTTMVADKRQHLVCVLSADVDANNLELANDGTNYGDITVYDFRVYNESKSADWAKQDYLNTRKYY